MILTIPIIPILTHIILIIIIPISLIIPVFMSDVRPLNIIIMVLVVILPKAFPIPALVHVDGIFWVVFVEGRVFEGVACSAFAFVLWIVFAFPVGADKPWRLRVANSVRPMNPAIQILIQPSTYSISILLINHASVNFAFLNWEHTVFRTWVNIRQWMV